MASGESIRGFAGLDITPQSSSQPGPMNNSTAAKAADGGGGDYLDGFESRKASKISRKKSEMSGKFGFGDDSLSRTPTSRSNGSQTSVASSNISGVGFHSNGGEDVDSDTECDVDDYQSDDPPSLSALKPPAPTKRRPPSPPPSPSRLTKGHLVRGGNSRSSSSDPPDHRDETSGGGLLKAPLHADQNGFLKSGGGGGGGGGVAAAAAAAAAAIVPILSAQNRTPSSTRRQPPSKPRGRKVTPALDPPQHVALSTSASTRQCSVCKEEGCATRECVECAAVYCEDCFPFSHRKDGMKDHAWIAV